MLGQTDPAELIDHSRYSYCNESYPCDDSLYLSA